MYAVQNACAGTFGTSTMEGNPGVLYTGVTSEENGIDEVVWRRPKVPGRDIGTDINASSRADPRIGRPENRLTSNFDTRRGPADRVRLLIVVVDLGVVNVLTLEIDALLRVETHCPILGSNVPLAEISKAAMTWKIFAYPLESPYSFSLMASSLIEGRRAT